MKYLLYAIAGIGALEHPALPPGLGQAALEPVRHGDLVALVSPLADERPAAGIEDAIEYARVVEALHRRFPILPMRYGCFVPHRAHAAEFLNRFTQLFTEALRQVEGRDEMGVRILIENDHAAASAPSERAPAPEETEMRHDGRAYLATRSEYYARKDRSEKTARRLAEETKAAFSGLYVHCSSEHVVRHEGEMLSLTFLIDRTRLDEFRNAFLRFQSEAGLRATCSGPWPPYAFVAGLAAPSVAGFAEAKHLW